MEGEGGGLSNWPAALLYDGGPDAKDAAIPGPSNSIGAARATNSPVGPVYGRRNGMRHSLNRLM